jgi:hypothetical protein
LPADVVAADVVAGDVEVGEAREVAEAFLAAEVVFREEVAIFLEAREVFREEVAIFLEAREVFREVAAVSLAVAVSLIAAVFLAAAVVVSPTGTRVFPVGVVVAFPRAAAAVLLAEAAAVLLRIVFQPILRCSPISKGRGRVAAECHRVRPEVNPTTVVHLREEAQHNYRPEIEWVATSEVGLRKFPLAMKAA